MTPEAIRIVSQLRREFYSLFAGAMEVPVCITNGNPSMGNLPMASWIDDRQRLNYVRIYVYTAPDELIPERPFILRISVNKGGGMVTAVKWRKDCQGINQAWHFELTLLPEEILDFLPWIVSLVKSYDQGCASFGQEPPHPFDLKMANKLLLNDVWTQKARQFAHSLVSQPPLRESTSSTTKTQAIALPFH
ncbi:MAG TPA: hypothetical protein V6D30_14405 [Leptolyngbyaceae cyanobacterium]